MAKRAFFPAAVFVLPVFIFLSTSLCFAQGFPFLGEIMEDGVNVRAGQNQNFESVCKLDKESEVVVLAKSYSWYKVQLPAQASVFISDKYVSRLKGKQAKVTADKVNVRAGADINFSVIGQVAKDEVITILEEKPGWFKIAPVAQSYGWVKEELVKFKSATVPSPGIPAAVIEPEPEKERATFEVKRIEQPVTAKATLVVIEGELAALKQPAASDIQYQIIQKDRRVYLIRGLTFALENFVGFQVRVEGLLDGENPDPSVPQIVNVSKIQLIL